MKSNGRPTTSCWLAAILLLSLCPSVILAGPGPEIALTVHLLQEKSDPVTGTHREWLPAVSVKEGQTLYYTVRARNPGPQPMKDVVVVQPIPPATEYLRDSASAPGADIEFSIDGGNTFTIFNTAGGARKANPAAITHVRWRLNYPLAPGATVLLRFAVIFRGASESATVDRH
jgi:uncharacterized repeat protein (TIGR01451 family)